MGDIYDVILDDIENLKDDTLKYRKSKTEFQSEIRCPHCGSINSNNVDSRLIDGHRQRWKRCNDFGKRWSTIEVRI